MSLRIRAAAPADLDLISALHVASWRLYYRKALSAAYLAGEIAAERTAVWSQRLLRPQANQRVLVAEATGCLVAFACLYLDSDPHWGSLLDNIHVAPSHQRRGVGAELMTGVAEHCASSARAAGLFLWTLESNLGAQRFYERLGARRAGNDLWKAPDGGRWPASRYAWPDVRAFIRRS